MVMVMSMARSAARELNLLDINCKRADVSKIRMNKKADKKLGAVTDMFCKVLCDNCMIKESSMLYRKLHINNLPPLSEVMLLYDVENRFASISYNFLMQAVVEAQEEKAYGFELKMDGILKTRNIKFETVKNQIQDDKRQNYILDILNSSIIIKKIKQLDIVSIRINYSPDMRRWLISIKSLTGAATWILMPPVMQAIMPVESEIYRFMELIRMLSQAVRR